ncbi:MAG: aspartate:alanine exchanger family transporter [Chloroflexota bacterium]|jgi:putative transport protein
MIQILIDNPLLLLFVVAAIGYPIGRIKVYGVSLGVAAVLFAGLAVGALNPELMLPEIIYTLGLVIFVYTVGLSSGPGFFASLQRKGLRDNLLVLGMVLFAAALTIVAAALLSLPPTIAAGMYAGSLTNTPALAAVVDFVGRYAPPESLEQMLAEPVVGYSIAYPMGVVAMIAVVVLVQRLWRVDYAAEAQALPEFAMHRLLQTRTIEVTKPDGVGKTVRDLIEEQNWDVVFTRLCRNGHVSLVGGNVQIQIGDQLNAVGAPDELDRVTGYLGRALEQRLDFDRSVLDYRRMFVSNPEIVSRQLKELDLKGRFGAVVTRIRRGDFELVPRGDTRLELGDSVRVLARRPQFNRLRDVLGDSYRALSEIDILSFSLGVALGLLIGLIPVPLPGGIVFRLGIAGGPLVVALVLGRLGRTGPIVWSLPYGANLTLRQLGLVLFLAGIGTRAGFAFVTTLTQGNGFLIFLAGATITALTALGTLWIGHKLLKIPMGLLVGMLAGLQTQPAVLGFSLEQTRNELPNIGYAEVYPLAMISKILVAQLVLTLLL